MRLRSIAWLATIVALIVTTTAPAGAGQQTTAIALRSTLPRIEGETFSGKKVVLPQDVAGRAGLFVFSFSREAGEPARCWAESFSRMGKADTDAVSFGILMLGEVPWILRGIVVSGIKSGMPAATRDRNLKLFADEATWKARLGVQSVNNPHLVLVDRAGKVRWLYAGSCDDAGSRVLRDQLNVILTEKISLP